MLGMRTTSDYSEVPRRHSSLIVQSREAFSAESPSSDLLSHYVTPTDNFIAINREDIKNIPDVDKDKYSIRITGLPSSSKEMSLTLKEIKEKLPKHTLTVTIQCAGNRRPEMLRNAQTAQAAGEVGWKLDAIGNATWVGAKLADVLERVGIPKRSNTTSSGGKHVEFVSGVKMEMKGVPDDHYKASIPLSHATDPDADILLAYEMNGEDLPLKHGKPLRVLVPGVIGARSVKFLGTINILAEESQGYYMQKDYKMVPPYVTEATVDWSSRRPVMLFPVQSAITSPEDNSVVPPGKITIKGYTISGGGLGVERVDVSVDGGTTWEEASRYQKSDAKYISDSESRDKWAWVLFEHGAKIDKDTQIIVKAVDGASNVQPDNVKQIMNIKTILNNSWHRVNVKVRGSDSTSTA